MAFKDKIRYLLDGFFTKNRSFPEHMPSGDPPNFENGKVVLSFNYSTEKEFVAIQKFIKIAKKEFENCMVVSYTGNTDFSLGETSNNLFFLSRNDFNLFGKSKTRLNTWLNNNDFDVLFSFFNNSDYYCHKITSSIDSKFKVGQYCEHDSGLYDLTILEKSEDYEKRLELFVHYIKELNINK